MENKNIDFKLRFAAGAAFAALLANEILNFLKHGGLENPLAFSLFKIILFAFLLCITYANNLSVDLKKILIILEGVLQEIKSRNNFIRARNPDAE